MENASLYFESSYQKLPRWNSFFPGVDLNNLFSASASAVLLLKVDERMFAVPFGPAGRHYLKLGAYESRFGLRTVLNSVKEGSLRSIDTSTLESDGLQTRAQSTHPASTEDFGVDIARDLVRNVTGETIESLGLSKTISGKDAVHFGMKGTVNDLPAQLELLLEQSYKTDYQIEFPWVDNLKEINDVEQTQRLEAMLVAKLNDSNQPGKVWMTVPEILEWEDHGGFKYQTGKKAQLLADIYINNYKDHIGNEDITVESLKKHRVYRFSSDNEYAKNSWRVFDCLYFEIHQNNTMSFLTNGKWYQVKDDIAATTNQQIATIPRGINSITLPPYTAAHKDERAYNVELAAVNKGLLLDADPVMIVGRSKFEVCDVYLASKFFIHNKMYSSSSTLSHLFNQGYVSADLFMDEAVRQKVNEKFTGSYHIPDTSIVPNANSQEEYTVAYGIITAKPESFDLPFFSKISLVHVARSLRNMGFGVRLILIPKK